MKYYSCIAKHAQVYGIGTGWRVLVTEYVTPLGLDAAH